MPAHHINLHGRRRSLFWRIHLWAALIASPFALIATLTGILYIFTPQIEAALYHHLDQVTPDGAMRPLDEAVAAASAAIPAGLRLHSVMPAYAPDQPVRVTLVPQEPDESGHAGHQHMATKPARPRFGPPKGAQVVYINPYNNAVLGTLGSAERFNQWAKRLHSRLLQGDGWRWLIELATSSMMVMLLTGIYLWWPRGTQPALPQSGASGRKAWKQWHGFAGVALGIMSLIILTTGLTWSKYAGEQVRTLRDASGQASPQVPPELHSTPMAEGSAMLSWQTVWELARQQSPDVALQLSAPRAPQQVWRIGAADRGQPDKRFDLLLDAYSGRPLYYSGWTENTAFGKATAVGIPFHRGEFGWWNQALLLAFGLGVLFSLVSGWVMFFKRRRSGWLGLPRLTPGSLTSPSLAMWLLAAALCWLMPLLAASAALVLACELLLARGNAQRKAQPPDAAGNFPPH